MLSLSKCSKNFFASENKELIKTDKNLYDFQRIREFSNMFQV